MTNLFFELNDVSGIYFYSDINELSDHPDYEWFGNLEAWHLSSGVMPSACQGTVTFEEARKIYDEYGANEGNCTFFE